MVLEMCGNRNCSEKKAIINNKNPENPNTYVVQVQLTSAN